MKGLSNFTLKKKLFAFGLIFAFILMLSSISLAAETITSTDYIVKANAIMNIKAPTTVEEFLNEINVSSGASKTVLIGRAEANKEELVRTGMTLQVGTDTTYDIIVRGDANGDGRTSATDYALLQMHMIKDGRLSGVYKEAVDINLDGSVSTTDAALLKCILVDLNIRVDDMDLEGAIKIIPSTTDFVKQLDITVLWPDDIAGLSKIISINNGRTYSEYTGPVTMSENNTVIARLVNSSSRVIESSSLEIKNIDIESPEEFEISVDHRVTNVTIVSGEATDKTSGIAKYYFTSDNGVKWAPISGQLSGTYVFRNLPTNTVVNLGMKAADKLDNTTTTPMKAQRTFKSGIDLLNGKLNDIDVDPTRDLLILPDSDGRVLKLVVNDEFGYSLITFNSLAEAEEQRAEEENLNNKVSQYVANGINTTERILIKLTEDGLGEGTISDNRLTVELAKGYNIYTVVQTEDGEYKVKYIEYMPKNGLTASGQIAEEGVLNRLEEIVEEKKNETNAITKIFDQAVRENILYEENVNRGTGIFETEVGLVYKILPKDDYRVDLLGLAEDVENEYIAKRILATLKELLQNQIIDWAIADGLTTAANTNRAQGIFVTTDGQYKQVEIDMDNGKYGLTDVSGEKGSISIDYSLEPDFPTMVNKTKLYLDVTSNINSPIKKVEVITEVEEKLLDKNYNDTVVRESVDILGNGVDIIRAYLENGEIVEKEITIGNIASILPIRVTINPETPRNTTAVGSQNGVTTGPMSVTLEYGVASLLSNADKYQYQINTTTGPWLTATRTQFIDGITENCKIYARYFDGETGLKQIEVVVDNIDNIAPNAFDYSVIKNSNSISVNANAVDTAADSAGHVSRDGVQGIEKYLYKMNDGEWQTDNVFAGLIQSTDYRIYVKAIDYAGNETDATNSGSVVKTDAVPNASEVLTFQYSNTEFTRDAVNVKINSSIDDKMYIVKYQVVNSGEQLSVEKEKVGKELSVINNCDIYARIVDTTGQTSLTNDYAIGQVRNIDNLAPKSFIPKIIATTKNSITVLANADNEGDVEDNDATGGSASSGIKCYDYYIIGSDGTSKGTKNQVSNTFTFEGVEPAQAYSIYVIATDNVGNSTTSETISAVTNGTHNHYGNVNSTISQLIDKAAYNNPIIPAGFAPKDTDDASWGDGTNTPADWNKGLVIEDKEGNQFVWVPVDGTNVKYEKYLTAGISYTSTINGTSPIYNGEVIDEYEQIREYGGFYVSRFEASKNSSVPASVSGQTPWTTISYSNAKIKAEKMYSTISLQSGLLTGAAYDTLAKWIQNEKGSNFVTSDQSWGNFPVRKYDSYTEEYYYVKEKKVTGSSDTYKVKNIYDIIGNAEEFTNELSGGNPVVRGGSYDQAKTMAQRSTYTGDYSNANLGFRVMLFVRESKAMDPDNDGSLGIEKFNTGPGNITINKLEPSYYNPVIPVGFKAHETAFASWTGLPTPSGWNKGLVIEDTEGNQYVWVPVDKDKVKYEKWFTIFGPGGINEENISGDEISAELQELGKMFNYESLSDIEKAQVEKYGGFYIGRYEAGVSEGVLATKAGLKVVNGITYSEAKEYAESMYKTQYVKSGLLTGTAWDTTMKWIANSYGENQVIDNKRSGNNYNVGFMFSGEYAEGPYKAGELRGEYKIGNNVSKLVGKQMLIATGTMAEFEMKNIYDLAGNVWEYTSEYKEYPDGNRVYVARGGDYYREFEETDQWGASLREGIIKTTGERRNEGGFRIMLFLMEGVSEVGSFSDVNRTINGQGASHDNPVIPAGFRAVNVGANWGNGITTSPEWNEGLVIEDGQGNQFVWVPVDEKDVEYKKWLTRGISYKDTDDDELPAKVQEWGQKEEIQVKKYGGFYISRYEISKQVVEDKERIASKASPEAWVDINYNDAKKFAESIYVKDKVTSGLITGTQWDTTMRWIANSKSVAEVNEDSSSWGDYINTGLGSRARAKNIFSLAGGNWEWTSEISTADKAIYRGGVKTDTGNSSPAGYRGEKLTTTIDAATTFRMTLYVTGEIEAMASKPVSPSEPLPGTLFVGEANPPVLTNGMTPVKYVGNAWMATTAGDPEWYAYNDVTKAGESTSNWANAKTPDGSFWVWIPRFAVNESTGSIIFLSGTSEIPCSNEVTSLEGYTVPVAFTAKELQGGWDRELEGFWVAKYETSGNTIFTVGSFPNRESFAFKTGSVGFSLAKNARLGLKNEDRKQIDVHMAKNSEWKAVAYLAASKYGANCGKDGRPDSTTNNIYGVYQMCSGRDEYVTTYSKRYTEARFENIKEIVNAEAKYKEFIDFKTSWDSGSGSSNDTRTPLMDMTGLFSYTGKCSNNSVPDSFRMIIIPEEGAYQLPSENLGKYVNYSARGVTKWRVLTDDGTNITLISADTVTNTSVDPTSGVTTLNNIAKNYSDGNYCASARSVNYSDISAMQQSEMDNLRKDYWLATAYYLHSPVMNYVSASGEVVYGVPSNIGVRVVINLKSNVEFKGGAGTEASPLQLGYK